MIRLFCAIELPIALRDRLIALGGGLSGAHWVPEENLHLTLNFIGEVQESSFDDIAAALSGTGVPVFDVVVKGMGHFEHAHKPTMLWAGVEANPQLTHLHDRIASSLRRVGIKVDNRQFQPHIMLARFDDHVAPEHVAGFLRANSLFRAPAFTVEQFVLFSSVLGHAGPKYRVESEFPLEGTLGLSDEDFRA
jgi:2'-5' RNA ligase